MVSNAIWTIMSKELEVLEKAVIACSELYPGSKRGTVATVPQRTT
jgi:hypothetical protein